MHRTSPLVLASLLALTGAATATAGPVPTTPLTGGDLAKLAGPGHRDPFTGKVRCGTLSRDLREALYGSGLFPRGGSPLDCSATSTTPDPGYDAGPVYRIPVMVHVIMNDACTTGVVSDTLITSQIDILNEDFRALVGTPGENGNDVQVEFLLVGATRTCNTTWFNDAGTYWDTLGRDPSIFLNMYTNDAGGNLGYVPFLPADGGGAFVGTPEDRVVIYWESLGRNSPFPPYDQGRTATHEVGHYIGLEHPFSGGCGTLSSPGCYSTGDLICDTLPDSAPHFGCPTGAASCGGQLSPITNYMEYSDDTCMEDFTLEQSRRMRCTLQNWRTGHTDFISFGGFETGDTSEWSAVVP